MLQNINDFRSNYLVVPNHIPPTGSLNGLRNWTCKHLLAQQGYSKHENKDMAFFSFLPIKEHEHDKLLFRVEAATLFFLLKMFKSHMLETVWNSRKNEWHSSLSPRSEGASMWAPATQRTTAAESAKQTTPHTHTQHIHTQPQPLQKGHPPPCLLFKLRSRGGKKQVPSPFPATLFPLISSDSPAATSPWKNTFLADQVTHLSCAVSL